MIHLFTSPPENYVTNVLITVVVFDIAHFQLKRGHSPPSDILALTHPSKKGENPMKSITVLSLMGLVVCLCACAPTAEPPPAEPAETFTTEADVETINKLGEEFTAAIKESDIERLLSFYKVDAVLMPPNESAAKGNKAIRAWFQSFFDQFTVEDFSFAIEEVTVAGDWAFRGGSFTMAFSPAAGGDQMTDVGKFIEIWQRQPDGSWKMARDIWNSDNPLPSK